MKRNLHLTSLHVILCILTSTNQAQGEANKIIFSCNTASGKYVEIGRNGENIYYSFGSKKQTPEIRLEITLAKAKILLESISGNEISSYIAFTNADFQYAIVSSINKNAETQEPKHGVLITRNSTYLGYKACDPSTVKGSLLDLSD